ncbi:hypothetical protein LTR37_002982 [Vermiconidia calcicola]|uniref:Uncharacterized protein n=1 Tax=Vermiconidia calcicola TaxID=1690605 RepID=A0ACC3NRW7_9PEZI|nr:hypothetical protein LTR37_002982 [Vermiconidia calcicola]
MYGAGGMGYRGPQTATYDAHRKNEDALPAMPSWNTAASKHVEEDNYQMEKLNQQSAQQEGLLSNTRNSGGRYYNDGAQEKAGDLGTMQAGPYHNYDQHQQFVSSPVSTTQQSTYPPTYQTRPQSSVYENASECDESGAAAANTWEEAGARELEGCLMPNDDCTIALAGALTKCYLHSDGVGNESDARKT